MKKFFLVVFLGLLVFVLPNKASAQSDSDYIRNFSSNVTFNQDASIDIEETIDYVFTSYRHGIYREIPTNYKTQGSFTRPTLLKLKELYYFETTNPSDKYDSYEKSSSNGYTIFKIGDADETIIGNYTYIIDYKLTYAVNYFDDHDELYLNITGNGWEVPIQNVEAIVNLPGEITDSRCYTGYYEETYANCTIEKAADSNTLTVTAGPLDVYEGLTVVVAMPKGTVADTTAQQRFQTVLANLGILLVIPVIVLVIVLAKIFNKNKKLTIIPHYDAPKGMNPLIATYVYKKNLPNNGISAEIIYLAINKYIKIKQISEKDYELIKTGKTPPEDSDELKLYNGLFESGDAVSLKKLSTKFFNTITTLRGSLDKRMYDEGYFSKKQSNISGGFLAIGVIGLFLIFASAGFFSDHAAMSWFFGLLLSFVVIVIFATQIDKRDTKGNELFYELEGLKMYINTAEKHRIEFHDNPKKYLGVFEKLLPYAIIFGLEKKWAKEFEDLYTTPPEWYDGNNNFFNSYILANSLTHMNQQIATRAVATNSSRGFSSSHGGFGGSGFSGGSSGGGFGGGGGGSW